MKISKRHLAKSISWRVIGTIDTFIFAWIITGDFNEGLNLSGITTITKLVWYYIHERLWIKSSITNPKKLLWLRASHSSILILISYSDKLFFTKYNVFRKNNSSSFFVVLGFVTVCINIFCK